MKKNNTGLLLLLILFSACTKKEPKTLLSLWEKNAEESNVAERTLASSPQGQCLTNIFKVDTIKAQIRDIEKKFNKAPKVTGTWKHLDLSKLPVPQANFLKSFGSQIGDLADPDRIDYSTCESVPCIFNKIYGKDEHTAGYVHYYWYLKFGNMLSADNKVPEQESMTPGYYNNKSFPLSAYLYNENELYGLWRLTMMLEAPHTTLKYLKEVQRVPRGERFEGGDDYADACGLASSAGWIKLNDGCLTIYDNKDTGYLYQALTHELAHHVDFEEGRGSAGFYRSHKQDYLDLAGMYINEYVDEKGVPKRQWKLKEGAKLMTDYAGKAPQENFAESLAVFRHDGDHAKTRVTDAHYKFLSKDYYQDRFFEKEHLFKTWFEKNSSETGKDVFKAVVDCSKEKSPAKSTYFKSTDFSTPVLPGMLNCMGGKAVEIGRNLRAKLALYEPEGCLALNSLKSDTLIKDHLKSNFGRYMQELKKDKNYLVRIQRFYDQLSDKKISRDSYLTCYGEAEEESCYENEVNKAAYEKALTLKMPPEQTQEMADMYSSYHSYASISRDIKQSYRQFVSANLESIRSEAEEIWEECRSINHNDNETPSGGYFQISDGYMISSFYNCLNTAVPEAVKDAVRNLSVDGIKLQHAKEEIILSLEVQPELIKRLKEIYGKEKGKEYAESKKVIAEDKGAVRQKLLSNFSWIQNIIETKQIVADCKKEAYKLLPFKPLYHLHSELFSEYLEKDSCLNISGTMEFNNWMNASKGSFVDKIGSSMDLKILEAAKIQAETCLKEFPVDTVTNKVRFRKEREACLVDEWPQLEEKVLAETLKDPLAERFQMSKDVLRVKLESKRRRLQLRIIKEHFN